MNKDTILKRTSNYQNGLIEDLRDADEATAYLEAALEAYDEDGHTDALLVALRNVIEAQGGVDQLTRHSHLDEKDLSQVLAGDAGVPLDVVGAVLQALGLRLSVQPLQNA